MRPDIPATCRPRQHPLQCVWPCPTRRCPCSDCGTGTPDRMVDFDTGAHRGACAAARAPLRVQNQVCLGWVRGVECVPCQQSEQTWTYSVLHVSVSVGRTFAPKIAVRWICSPNYCNKTHLSRAKTIQIRRSTQCRGARRGSTMRATRLGRRSRTLLVDIPVGPAPVMQGLLPRSRVHQSFPIARQVPTRVDCRPQGACC